MFFSPNILKSGFEDHYYCFHTMHEYKIGIFCTVPMNILYTLFVFLETVLTCYIFLTMQLQKMVMLVKVKVQVVGI